METMEKVTQDEAQKIEKILSYKNPVHIIKDMDNKIGGMYIPSNAIEKVIESFVKEDDFIYVNRPRCLWILLAIVIVSVVAVFALIVINIFFKIDTVTLIASLSTLLIEILGLLSIIFRYLFNRSENKVLDIVSDIIKNIISVKKHE